MNTIKELELIIDKTISKNIALYKRKNATLTFISYREGYVDKNTESYTKITFVADWKRFGLKKLTSDMAGLMKRRVYDTAGTTITGGVTKFNMMFTVGGSALFDLSEFNIYVNPGDVLTFAIKASASSTVACAINWTEDL